MIKNIFTVGGWTLVSRITGFARDIIMEAILGARPNADANHVDYRQHKKFPVAEGGLPVTEKLSQEVISLPMHAYLDEPTQDRICDAVKRALVG
jgi:dTDP-4-amino-4,6-dideoxygalactose transaminase